MLLRSDTDITVFRRIVCLCASDFERKFIYICIFIFYSPRMVEDTAFLLRNHDGVRHHETVVIFPRLAANKGSFLTTNKLPIHLNCDLMTKAMPRHKEKALLCHVIKPGSIRSAAYTCCQKSIKSLRNCLQNRIKCCH